MKRAIIYLILSVLTIPLIGCLPDAEEDYLAMGPGGMPVIHEHQEGADWCTVANTSMKITYHGLPRVPQIQIYLWGNTDGTPGFTIQEAHDYLLNYQSIITEKYYYIPPYNISADSIVNAWTNGLAQAHYQGASCIVPVFDAHTITTAGHCEKGGEVKAIIVVDPAIPDTAREKYIRLDKRRFAEASFMAGTGFIALCEPVSVSIFSVLRSDESPSYSNENLLALQNWPTDENYHDRYMNPQSFSANLNGAEEETDSTQLILIKANQALLRFLSNAILWQAQERFGALFDDTYFGDPIYTSEQNPWDPPTPGVNKVTAPSLYMISVPIYSALTEEYVGSVNLKYGELDSVLSVVAMPPRPGRESECKPFITIADIEEYFGTTPIPFVSQQTCGITGSFPLVDIPNYQIIDQELADTIYITAFGDELAYDDNSGGVYLAGQYIKSEAKDGKGDHQTPDKFKLHQNYPNPFNPHTKIGFSLRDYGHVNIGIYNIVGQRIATILDEDCQAGDHVILWDGNDESGQRAASGLYFYRMTCDGKVKTRKMILLK
jgi:hypothetical protein